MKYCKTIRAAVETEINIQAIPAQERSDFCLFFLQVADSELCHQFAQNLLRGCWTGNHYLCSTCRQALETSGNVDVGYACCFIDV